MKTLQLGLAFICLFTFNSQAREVPASSPTYAEAHEFLFFAVLEGLYQEGPSPGSVAHIMGDSLKENFVYGCPICIAVYDAFLVFQKRPDFPNRKRKVNDFGAGLESEERKALAGSASERRKQINQLVERWTEQRFAKLALTAEEKAKLRKDLREMKDQGTELLKAHQEEEVYGNAYENWTSCPSCDGASPSH